MEEQRGLIWFVTVSEIHNGKRDMMRTFDPAYRSLQRALSAAEGYRMEFSAIAEARKEPKVLKFDQSTKAADYTRLKAKPKLGLAVDRRITLTCDDETGTPQLEFVITGTKIQ